MNSVEKQILDALARVETKLDFHKEQLVDQEIRLKALEKKWWATLGAAILSVSAYIKSLFS